MSSPPASSPATLIQQVIESMRSPGPRWKHSYHGGIDVVDASRVDDWADELEAALARPEGVHTHESRSPDGDGPLGSETYAKSEVVDGRADVLGAHAAREAAAIVAKSPSQAGAPRDAVHDARGNDVKSGDGRGDQRDGASCPEAVVRESAPSENHSDGVRAQVGTAGSEPADSHSSFTARPEGEDWQPIETAPKDGTRILIVSRGVVLFARWDEKAAFERFECRPGWQVFACEDGFYSWAEEPQDVTLWMPSPSLPQSEPRSAPTTDRSDA